MNDGAGITLDAGAILDRVADKASPPPFPAEFDPGAATVWLAGWLIPLA